MLAVQIQEFGEPSNTARVREVPDPVLQPGEILVKVEAAGVNPSDLVNIRGGFHHTSLPRVIGRDFAGAVTGGAAELKGREVWGSGGDIGLSRDGTHAEYITIPESAISIRPAGLSPIDAAASALPYITAWSALVDRAQIKEGDYVVVSGAAGAVGWAAVQLAFAHGAKVIALLRDESERAFIDAEKIVAVALSDRNDLEEVVKKTTEEKGANIAFNTVGASIFDALYNSLAIFGKMVIISRIGGAEVKLNLFDFYRRDLTLIGLDTAKLSAEQCARILDKLVPEFEKGLLRPVPVAKTIPLSEALSAYESLAHGAPGKLVLVP